MAGTDANSYVKANYLWLDTMLSLETRVSSEAETIERTALVFRTGWIPANHKSKKSYVSARNPLRIFLGDFYYPISISKKSSIFYDFISNNIFAHLLLFDIICE